MFHFSLLGRKFLVAGIVLASGFSLSACEQLIYGEGPHTVRPVSSPSKEIEVESESLAPAPVKPEETPQREGGIVVEKGETLYAVARKHEVALRDLIEINNLQPPYALNAGQFLKLPDQRVHTVKAGETLHSVSRHYGIDSSSLVKINKLQMPYTIKIGQRLRLPAPSSPGQVKFLEAPASTNVLKKEITAEPLGDVSSSAGSSKPMSAEESLPFPDKTSGKFQWPVKGEMIMPFGPLGESGLYNDGINIAALRGAPVVASESGTVVYSGNELSGFGNLLLIKHKDGWMSAYAHNQEIVVKRGEKVSRGQIVAKVGSTGNVSDPQLHFELRRGSRPVDPRPYL